MQIVAENLGKRFQREWIFRNLSQTFKTGHTYAIVGPNGSGKSTLLHVLWGQMPPSSGHVRWREGDGEVPPDDIFRHLAIAAPYMELIDEFTLEEMVAFHFKFKRTKPGIPLTEICDRMELGHARKKKVGQFSSGMRQRLKLALAFYSDTKVVFLDEPTTNLDQRACQWYQKNLAESHDRLVFIASNQEHEYPETAVKINIANIKPGVTPGR